MTKPRRQHSNGKPIASDYAKIAACAHDAGTRDEGSDEVCARCGLIVACAPGEMEPQLRQLYGARWMDLFAQK